MISDSIIRAEFWHPLQDGRIQCDLCPRYCKLRDGQRGLCFVRQRMADELVLTTYARSSGFCVDPIEKKPLNHFYPGSAVLSFGTAGCNLACKFCQNWDISKSRETDKLSASASPEKIVKAAIRYQCRSVAFTYNDPVIFYEYARDIAIACAESNIKTIAVTAGYISAPARKPFFKNIDAVNVDLKAFTEDFYYQICGGKLQDVLDTLLFIKHETSCWLEITTLLIPGKNDSEEEIRSLVRWIIENLGYDVPLHFTAFHPDWKMLDVPRTPKTTLSMARSIAVETGANYVYTGNVHDTAGASTYCPNCKNAIITRDWHKILDWKLTGNGRCQYCKSTIAGEFDPVPGRSPGFPVRVDMNEIEQPG